jgi:hypothetical protein
VYNAWYRYVTTLMGKNKLRYIIIGTVVLALLIIGGLSVYKYAGAGVLNNQKHMHSASQLSEQLSQPHSLVASSLTPANSKTISDTTSSSSSSKTTTKNAETNSSLASPLTPADSQTIPVASVSLPTNCWTSEQQAQLTSWQSQISTLTQQKDQLLADVGGLLNDTLSVLNQQKLQQLENQITALQNQVQSLTGTSSDCQTAS